jgi:NAD(P)-dependent dehydrogenase (short-subunit alcohol dehydrogenase family)
MPPDGHAPRVSRSRTSGPQTVADLAAVLASDEASYITGTVIDGGMAI